MSTQGLNGVHAVADARDADARDPLDDAVATLEELLPSLRAEREQAEAHLREVSGREERARAGIAALTGGKGVATSGGTKAGKALKPQQNPPSQKLQDDIYAAIAKARKPPTIVELADLVGVSRSAVDGTVRHLRNVERVRVCGVRKTNGRNSGNVFAVMP